MHRKNQYRHIAKWLNSKLPLSDDEFGASVPATMAELRKLPLADRLALKEAYIWSRKVPAQEREDLFGDIALVLIEKRVDCEPLAYAIARNNWRTWWSKYKLHSQFNVAYLSEPVSMPDGETLEYGETLVGEVEFERKLDGEMDGKQLYDGLPRWVQELVQKRLLGIGIRGGDRRMLDKWLRTRPTILAHYVN